MKLLKLFIVIAICGTVLTATPASASHDTIYSPCGTEYGFIHMTYDEWAAHITTMEADGTIPPGIVFRYNEALHGGKGLEDPRVVWARNLTDGQILSIDDWANGSYPEIEALMFSSGLIPEWILDANRTIRRFNDPYWAAANPMTPSWTVWQSLCMGNYGYSIPVMEINEDGVWVSNLPTTTTTTQPAVEDPAPETNPPSDPEDADPSPQLPTTTTIAIVPTTTTTPVEEIPECGLCPLVESATVPPVALNGSYTLFDAEWDGYPFEQTILLLEERYPPGTPGKHHFRLSAAVDFLRAEGMVRGLDNLWNSGTE
jgi:hypothetical protein